MTRFARGRIGEEGTVNKVPTREEKLRRKGIVK